MRVAFVLGTTSGGTGRYVRMLVEGLVRRGHQVLVLGPRSVEEWFSYTEAGARFVGVAIADRPHPVNDLRAVLAVRRLTREADVVHAHGLRAGALSALARPGALVRRGTRPAAVTDPGRPGTGGPAEAGGRGPSAPGLVVTLHNALTAGGFVGVVYGVLERLVARGAGRVLVVSPDLGARMTRLGARDVRAAVVPAPVPRPAKRTPQEVRDELDAGERPILLTVARLAQQKGLETLLDVAAGPWEEGRAPGTGRGSGLGGSYRPEVMSGAGTGGSAGGAGGAPLFVVAGDGPLRARLQRRIDDERLPVKLLGHRDDVPDLLHAAVALVMPSRWEGQPLTLREALMTGTPAIASKVGGIPEILGQAGFLVPYGDVEGLRRAVRELLAEGGTARTLAAEAERRGREMPGDDDAVRHVLAVYGEDGPTGD
ncbi:glycosyltransferase family 4 protein [Nonomuraea sp. KC401]|uniref:glycosyltransferase family 4 protein n=1 Tax=unclassified Nonomuraea TaxID=2593643 RepID=UPI0010FD7E01|nr:glycosyltransferase family 4 protein [Nonomuraea sp. KC401]NBE99430.1 glycosyltransferase [Nonomuraea sp. K271]TLF57358.1 glycosyltransferase family 4 protein [Nonomuraea sp. KC401]